VVDRAAAEVRALVERREVEVGPVVERLGQLGVRVVGEQEELDLRADLGGPAEVGGRAEHAREGRARVGGERLRVRPADRAEHPPDLAVAPGEQGERARVGIGDDVPLPRPCRPLHRRAVEPDALLERRLELGHGDGQRLEDAEHVDEPQAHEADAPLLHRAQDVCVARSHLVAVTVGALRRAHIRPAVGAGSP
jgi:hypothetical protein